MNMERTKRPSRGGRRPGQRKRGYVYLAVLFTSLIVVATVSAALSVSTASLRRASDRSHRDIATRMAEAELHRIGARMRSNKDWRRNRQHATLSDWYTLNIDGIERPDVQFRNQFSDPDGQLDNRDTDSVVLTVQARIGDCQSAVSAELETDPRAFEFLRYAVTATDDIELDWGGSLSCQRPVQAADDCKSESWGVLTTPQLELGGYLGTVLRGDLSKADLVVPNRDPLADYISVGTEIARTSIRGNDGGDGEEDGDSDIGPLIIRDIVLSPTVNPYGAVDPAGIYWIDAGGNEVRIRDCRIDATLAIRNAAYVEIVDGIVWSYPDRPDAILVSDSTIHFHDLDPVLDEADRRVNFNPISSPYRDGPGDGDQQDRYPTELRGAIVTTGDVHVDELDGNAGLLITGSIFCTDLRISGDVDIQPLDELYDEPKFGLSDPTPMRWVWGSLRHVPSPQP